MSNAMGERLWRLALRYPIDESLVFGLDVGIASVGSAVVRHAENRASIEFAGCWCFEAPEVPKTKELKNKTRRDKRLLRRITRRRRERMAAIRSLLTEARLLRITDPDEFHHSRSAPDPWEARANGLDRKLADDEFCAALLHIAKHRGFKSNRKSEVGQNAPDESKQMLSAIEANREASARYRTAGEMVARDPKFTTQKRNRGGEYARTLARDDLRDEVGRLFDAQRRLGSDKATVDLEGRYTAIAFHQRPLQDTEHIVGMCPFEPEARRSPRHAPSFEKFRYIAKLNTVKVRQPDGTLRRFSREELGKAVSDFGVTSKSVTWNALAKKIGLRSGTDFDSIDEKRAKLDVAASGGSAAGTKALYDVLGPAGWNLLKSNPELLDQIATIISFREDLSSIRSGLDEIQGLDPLLRSVLIDAVQRGDFGTFRRAGHISSKAARNVLPYLLEGHVYSKACMLAGYDHTITRRIELEDIRNAVVQRSLRESVKQVEALVHQFGSRPGRVIVELARDVGKSPEERDKISRGIEKRTAEKQRRRAELKELLDLDFDPTEEDLRRYELWKEQNKRCIYTDRSIAPTDILSTSNTVQIDHVLPRSRSQDNSYHNQVLCFAKANQDKRQRTPWEWWSERGDLDTWDAFEARIRALNIKGMKKRNLLMHNFEEREQGFVERNLNDTKYAARALLSALRQLYGEREEPDPASEGYLRKRRRLFARPGQMTAILRRSWGLDGFKDRADDRHHAIDALICAATPSEWLLQSLTRQYQLVEIENRARWVPPVPLPWESFRDEALASFDSVFVARSEKRRGRGQGHRDTIYSIALENGKRVTYERKAVSELTEADLARLKDAEGGNRYIAGALSDWIANGKSAEDVPLSAKGDRVRKVLLKRKGASGFDINGGHVDNSDIVRVDVFAKPNKSGRKEYYLVPIYRHQVMDKRRWPVPPNRAVRAYKPEEEWEIVGAEHHFCFSLYADAYVEVTKRDGVTFEGYFRSMNRSTGALTISPQNRRSEYFEGGSIGARTLKRFCKYQVDRLGQKHEIQIEIRTWHGAACT